jgi:HEAT repeat protein
MTGKLALLGLLLGATLAGCKVTAKDVDVWKGTVKGPGKMVAVMLADKYDVPLRAYAGVALVDMERQDVDGVAELDHTLTQLPPEMRDRIVDEVAPQLIELMNQPVPGQSNDPNAGPPTRQIRAKDAAFLLINHAKPEVRAKLTDAVVGWYTQDFNGRSLSGNYSAEQVVRALGSAAAKRLVEALSAKLPQQALMKLSELIGQLGSDETKKTAGDRLVQIELEMEGDPFLGWLKGQIQDQLGAKDAAKIDKMARINRDKFIVEGALSAMKYLADQPAVANRLLQIAATDAAELADRRTRALQAMEGKARKEHLDPLLALALNPASPTAVRDYAFDRVGDIRDPRAIPQMWTLVQDTKDQRLRWRAGELVLQIGGPDTLNEFFAKLPAGPDVEYEPAELEGYASRMGQMAPLPRDVALRLLGSPRWFDQVVALNFFERKGTAADEPAMDRLGSSSTPVKGKSWEKGDTLGTIAKRTVEGLRTRLKESAATATAAK